MNLELLTLKLTSVGTSYLEKSLTDFGNCSDVEIADKIVHTGDTNTSISFPSTDYIRLTTSGSSRLNVTPNGYILLGTNSEPSGGDAHSRNARLLIHGRVGNAADSGRINLQRGSSASNGSSIGSLTFTDNGNNAYARIETLDLMLHQELMIIQVELFSAPHQTDLHHQQKDFV